LIPDRRIIELSLNKYVDYLFLGEFMPYTTILSSFFQNTTIQEKFGDKIVLKPINSN
jgi:glutathione synthase/RimK-type ligase-like ATP-grasp enzyme